MGCICSKGIDKDEIIDEVVSIKRESDKPSPLATPTKKENEETLVPEAQFIHLDNAAALPAPPWKSLSNARENHVIVVSEEVEKNKTTLVKSSGHQRSVTVDASRTHNRDSSSEIVDGEDDALRIVDVPNGFSGEHVAAGWPSWLTSVAGEAINGWLPRRADSFEKLEKIGQGTYSSVYKARDLETGKTVALKKVRFVNMDPESVRFMVREIHILRKLDHPNVIKLEGIVTSRMSCNLYLVFEYMEHDLAGLASRPGTKFTEPQVKCFMQQLLNGLDHCHSRGVLHRDIKGSNLLVDSNGILRIGDFGLAAVFDPEQRQQLTSRVVTLWYRPPELLLGATEYGVAVDLWSSGCILAELLAGKPIMPGRTEVEQLHKIFKLCGSPAEEYWKKSKLSDATIFRPQHQYPRCVAETFRDFPSSALHLLDKLLAIEPTERGTAASALESEFFTTKPLPCDPSHLPKFPPSKEYDAKLRDEEARRHREAANKGGGAEPAKRGYRDQSKPVQDNNEKQQTNNRVGGFSIDPPTMNGYTHVGSTMHPGAYGNMRRKNLGESEHRAAPGCSVSTLKTTDGQQLRTQRSYMNRSGDTGDFTGVSGMVSERKTNNSRYNRLDIVEPSEKGHELDKSASSHHKKDNRGSKDASMGYGTKNKRIHYSGPLITPGGNMEDMLKEHERQIQQAVRNARNRHGHV